MSVITVDDYYKPAIGAAIFLTDRLGRLLRTPWTTIQPGGSSPYREPSFGSVVLTQGATGTAWQRHHSDGLWHRTGGGKPRSWMWLLQQRNLVLVYETNEED